VFVGAHGPGLWSRNTIIPNVGGSPVLVLGIIFLLLGLLLGVSILWTIGVVLLVIGAVLWIAGATGHQVGSRRHYW
jgi:hypothetical protein